MLPRHHDPIVAVATAPGRGAVGIVRVSGRGLQRLIDAICRQSLQARRATYLLSSTRDGEPIDEGLAIHFPAPHSYTGEDVLELHAHGGPVVLQLLLARCLEAAREIDANTGEPRLRRLRVAEPGEFTERAFLNDKLDLAQAEAVSDLIDASTEAAARSASRSLQGAFSREIDALRTKRSSSCARWSRRRSTFPMKRSTSWSGPTRAGSSTRSSHASKRARRARARARCCAKASPSCSPGQPNVGKSSLLNALAGAELAIVTPIPGTTRDKVSQTIQIEGVPLHVIDTAGLRESAAVADEVEQHRHRAQLGRDRACRRGAVPARPDARGRVGTTTRVTRTSRHACNNCRCRTHRLLHIHNKADVVAPPADEASRCRRVPGLASTRCGAALLELAGWHAEHLVRKACSSRAHAMFRRCSAHADASRARARAGARQRPGARPARRGASPCAQRARRDHRRVHVGRSARRDLQPLLHREVSPRRTRRYGALNPCRATSLRPTPAARASRRARACRPRRERDSRLDWPPSRSSCAPTRH